MIEKIIKIWNNNFNKGVTTFQIFLMIMMIVGAIYNNYPVIMVSMASCLIGYFEPNQWRFNL